MPVDSTPGQDVSPLDYIALFSDFVLALVTFYGIIISLMISQGLGALHLNLMALFGLMISASTFGFSIGMLSSVQKWDECVTTWHMFILFQYSFQTVLMGSRVIVEKHLEGHGM